MLSKGTRDDAMVMGMLLGITLAGLLAALGLSHDLPPVAAGAASIATTSVSGRVVDRRTGRGLANVTVAIAPFASGYDEAMAGDHPPALPLVETTLTAPDGSFVVATTVAAPKIVVDIYGAPTGHVTFHGIFASGSVQVGTVALITPSREERLALAQINAFRRAPGGSDAFGSEKPLVFDQNLVQSARYWAREEMRSRHIGHTCAELGSPKGCVEFNAYFHALPGAPPDDDAGQNAAFDSETSWSEPDKLFEIEGALCGYNWRSCRGGADGSGAQTGHYVNLMLASRWIGFGKAVADGYGSFFAQNLL